MTYRLTTGWPQRIADGAFVNPDTNPEYLAWLAAGNTPLPAEQLDYATAKARILAEVRSARQPVLDALMGIAGRKHRGNKKDIADAIDIAAQGLLDLPNKASVQAATDEATLRAALKSEYDAIVLALATACGADWPDVQGAFRAYER